MHTDLEGNYVVVDLSEGTYVVIELNLPGDFDVSDIDGANNNAITVPLGVGVDSTGNNLVDILPSSVPSDSPSGSPSDRPASDAPTFDPTALAYHLAI